MKTVLRILIVACVVPSLSTIVDAKIHRSRAQVKTFLLSQGYTKTPHGFHVDHIVPLCAGGKDAPSNMQLLPIELHKIKTRQDIKNCRKMNRRD